MQYKGNSIFLISPNFLKTLYKKILRRMKIGVKFQYFYRYLHINFFEDGVII